MVFCPRLCLIWAINRPTMRISKTGGPLNHLLSFPPPSYAGKRINRLLVSFRSAFSFCLFRRLAQKAAVFFAPQIPTTKVYHVQCSCPLSFFTFRSSIAQFSVVFDIFAPQDFSFHSTHAHRAVRRNLSFQDTSPCPPFCENLSFRCFDLHFLFRLFRGPVHSTTWVSQYSVSSQFIPVFL